MAGIFDLKPRRSVFNPLSRMSDFRLKEERRSKALPMLLLGASLFLPLNAAAADPGTISTTLRGLIDWIGQQGVGLQAVDKIPALARVGRAELLALAFGDKLPRAVNNRNLKVYGLYNFENETVYLLDNIDLESERGRSNLLHELVHYLQYQLGVSDRVQCKNELEPLAYELEARYLAEHDAQIDFTYGQVRRLSRCAQPSH